MPEIRNCPRCGRVFSYINRPICNRCIDDEEQEFKKVKDYIYENPGANIPEVSTATEVSVEKIMRFLRDERLELKGDIDSLGLSCERCGVSIKSGRFCEKCKKDISQGFKREFGLDRKPVEPIQEKNRSTDKMFTATRRKGE